MSCWFAIFVNAFCNKVVGIYYETVPYSWEKKFHTSLKEWRKKKLLIDLSTFSKIMPICIFFGIMRIMHSEPDYVICACTHSSQGHDKLLGYKLNDWMRGYKANDLLWIIIAKAERGWFFPHVLMNFHYYDNEVSLFHLLRDHRGFRWCFHQGPVF